MRLFAHVRPLAAALVTAGILAGAAACDAAGDGTALPSSIPSLDRASRSSAATTSPTERVTRTAGNSTSDPEPTRTSDDPPAKPSTKPATTQPATTQPATTQPATTQPATEAATTPPAPEAIAPTTTATPSPAATTVSADPSAVAAVTTTSGMGTLGWLFILLIVTLAVLVAALLVSRSRRTAAWQSEAVELAGACRGLIATRLPQVLSTRDTAARALAWPPVRAELTEAAARWSRLATSATDDFRRDSAGQVSFVTQDLVTAVDAENEALATGRDWRLLSPQADDIVRTLDAALTAFLVPQPEPDPGGAQPYPA
jgi:hypothetical protein